MLRIVFASVVVASAHRINQNVASIESGKVKFGASCEDLQTMFHNRVVTLGTSVDALPDESAVGRGTQMRLMMRSYGVVRTLRRARDCEWVIANENDDLEQMRGIVQTFLAGNPCAGVARAELERGTSAETSEAAVQSLWRSMSVLMSDDCEVVDRIPEDVSEAALNDNLGEAESALQDNLEELEAASEGSEGAFIQTDARTLRGFFRSVGVALLMILLLVACTSAAVLIGAFIGFALYLLAASIAPGAFDPACTGCLIGDGLGIMLSFGIYGGGIGGVGGLVSCSQQLYNHLF